MAGPWPLGGKDLRIGILGLTEGNGHPYSWSAMFNGYDRARMDRCPFVGIPAYLNKQPPETFGIPGARVTHICCDDRADAQDVAAASLIEHVVDAPREMIGHVDAVICATDIGSEHVERCRPFIEAGLPLFIDKPMADNEEDLKQFVRWRDGGARFISSSSMRYQKEMEPYYKNHYEIGRLMYICRPMCKKWETYGIHALENIYPLLGPGFLTVRNTGTRERNMLHLVHESGCDVHIPLAAEMYGAFTYCLLVGSVESKAVSTTDSFYAFKKQLDLFVRYLRTGEEPFPFEETIELMKLVIAGILSREEGGRVVRLSEIRER